MNRFTPTLAQQRRYQQYAGKYLASIVEKDREGAAKDLALEDRPEWMSVDEALEVMFNFVLQPDDAMPAGKARADIYDAYRTKEGVSEAEWIEGVARRIGASTQQVRNLYVGESREGRAEGETALYRYFDGAGDLLYVGIAVDPEMREKQHEKGSRWVQFSERREVEWFPSREQARQAERDAIQLEDPVFNVDGRRDHARHRARQMEYLYDQIDYLKDYIQDM